MEARGDADTARQMGRLGDLRPRWGRDGGGLGFGFCERSTSRAQISIPSLSEAELRVGQGGSCQRRGLREKEHVLGVQTSAYITEFLS